MDIVDTGGAVAAYRGVHASLKKVASCWVESSEIKVIGPSHPIARDVLAFMASHPGRLVVRTGNKALGSMKVEQTYIYPSHVFTFGQVNPMTTEDVGREIVRLMTRGSGAFHPSRVALKDGTSFNGVPFSLQPGNQRAVVAQFIADGEPAPRVIPLDESASIA